VPAATVAPAGEQRARLELQASAVMRALVVLAAPARLALRE
jgi:hypothetical protein